MPENGTSRLAFISLLTLFLGLFLYMTWPYLLSLLVGLLLAIITRPLYGLLRRRRFGPKTAAVLTVLLILIAIIVPLSAFAVAAARQAIALADYLTGVKGAAFIDSMVSGFMSFKPVRIFITDPAQLHTQGMELAHNAAAEFSKSILFSATALPGIALEVTFALLAWFFLLFQGAAFYQWLSEKLPIDGQLKDRLASSLSATAASTIWANSAAAVSQSAVMMTGYWILGVPAIFLAGGATFIFAWLPIFGSIPASMAGCVYLSMKGSILKLVLMLCTAMVSGIIDNIVKPIVLKGRQNMHPLLALVAIFSGIRVFGLFGVIFGPIIAAMLLALLESGQLMANGHGSRGDPDTADNDTVP